MAIPNAVIPTPEEVSSPSSSRTVLFDPPNPMLSLGDPTVAPRADPSRPTPGYVRACGAGLDCYARAARIGPSPAADTS
eukprot:CAMPEP_0119500874 /NCGR_PEP_ID=MMETSP1344-20130328/22886_1 /TAXON_ID=236787 /ORGANISM="Florenciella parvula, Strain CCMP2471" /LENGTH=78 /DNA_ID=CAMNT_0007536995 /DNA_START=485 /DNA_END=718 /DNA_ORIENTATION=+